MICTIFKITTDAEGESKITICVPRSDLANAVSLLSLLEKRVEATFAERKDA